MFRHIYGRFYDEKLATFRINRLTVDCQIVDVQRISDIMVLSQNCRPGYHFSKNTKTIPWSTILRQDHDVTNPLYINDYTNIILDVQRICDIPVIQESSTWMTGICLNGRLSTICRYTNIPPPRRPPNDSVVRGTSWRRYICVLPRTSSREEE